MVLRGSLTMVEGEVTRLRGSPIKVKVTRLRGLLVQAKERVSYSERRASKVVAKVVEVFRKGEDFRQELLGSC